jgi:hypothetical protein
MVGLVHDWGFGVITELETTEISSALSSLSGNWGHGSQDSYCHRDQCARLHGLVGIGTNDVRLRGCGMFARSRNIDYKFTDIVLNEGWIRFHHLASPALLYCSSLRRRDDQHDYGRIWNRGRFGHFSPDYFQIG